MLQAHSFLWNYLWVAPNLILFGLGLLLFKKGRAAAYPAFTAFAILSPIGGLALYSADVIPSVSAVNFWRVDWVALAVDSVLKFLVIGEVFSRVFSPFPSVSKIGRSLVSAAGVLLVFGATTLAAFSTGDSTVRLISGVHLLGLTVFATECGLILFIFALVRYFRMPWDRFSFGILLGFGLSSCVYLAASAIITNTNATTRQRTLLDFLGLATYHITVLIWCYFLLVPGKKTPRNDDSDEDDLNPPSAGSGATRDHEEQLNEWNSELERLIH
jgi:hypothetical protein